MSSVIKKTVLHAHHVALGGKMVPFAGWEMPVQYPTGIFAEHRATRIAASLFDVSHMSVFEFAGSDARPFLECLLAGKVADLAVGRAAYNYILYPNGTAIDDTFLYHVTPGRYLLVVNAGNAPADWDWILAVQSGKALIDPNEPAKRMPRAVEIRDLRHAGADARVLIAFQGPKSEAVLMRLADSAPVAKDMSAMKRNDVRESRLRGTDVLLAKTGYTGEMTGFEIFVHPDRAPALWNAILEEGKPLGVLHAGLGARDAARLEAGLPLFGHELEGANKGTLAEAGYTWVVRSDESWFIGRDEYRRRVGDAPARKLVRLAGQGAKTVRDGHRILGDDGRAAGIVTSFAFLDEKKNFMLLAYVDATLTDIPGRKIPAVRMKEAPAAGEDISSKTVELTVLRRFPDKAERDEWRKTYGG